MEEITKSARLSETAVPTPLKTPTDVAPALVAESISWLLSVYQSYIVKLRSL